ncbi:hypothetical protein BO94DRAFT_599498 [Aspergillus sclerotioniger CBS 115572]|uniref:Uncharacterized protein n=1 Tax=Aspergillus sclerotioniger CBS 115572 TaxID=1450535 RepID=A0A317W8Z7_9EURO|nr:hypothetical protein BO94DRAFT_599498 [Aspergillus sclerotioniger CBS 115572]PWY83086.1 hypothetical protein BO94DRAFT_599498 [Aspergillus sclerotioniger CBS 115572]
MWCLLFPLLFGFVMLGGRSSYHGPDTIAADQKQFIFANKVIFGIEVSQLWYPLMKTYSGIMLLLPGWICGFNVCVDVSISGIEVLENHVPKPSYFHSWRDAHINENIPLMVSKRAKKAKSEMWPRSSTSVTTFNDDKKRIKINMQQSISAPIACVLACLHPKEWKQWILGFLVFGS